MLLKVDLRVAVLAVFASLLNVRVDMVELKDELKSAYTLTRFKCADGAPGEKGPG